MVVATQADNTVNVFINNGDGSFQGRVTYYAGNTPY